MMIASQMISICSKVHQKVHDLLKLNNFYAIEPINGSQFLNAIIIRSLCCCIIGLNRLLNYNLLDLV